MKKITLGVTGGISAYKAADLCSMLVKSGFEVRVVMTENATRFITPLVFKTLSQHEVVTTLWDDPDWKPAHIALANDSDLVVIAPATANFIAKLACGIADDALTSLCAAYHGKMVIAPAMNPAMWSNTACCENVALLKKRGVEFCGPAEGHVACGSEGAGRLEEVAKIFEKICQTLA